jgi:hypothetical protein
VGEFFAISVVLHHRRVLPDDPRPQAGRRSQGPVSWVRRPLRRVGPAAAGDVVGLHMEESSHSWATEEEQLEGCGCDVGQRADESGGLARPFMAWPT